MNHSCGIAVTPQGIPILYQPEDPAVKGRPLSVVVRAERVSFPEHFVISDDRQSESVIVLPQALNQIRHKTNDGQMYLRVRGVVATSVSQTGDEAPVLLLADVEVLGPIPLKEAGLTKRQYVPPRGKGTAPMQGGLAPVFFNRWSPFLRDEELAGSVAWLRVYFPDKPIEQYNEKISHFLERHDALRTLSRSNSASFANISKEVANHRTAVAEFDSAQMNRQNATLTSNAGWESAEVAEKVVEQHKKALEFALHMDSTLMTVDKLCQCHAILCGNGLLNNAGTLRKTKVRVGDTSFQAPDGIQRDLDSTCRSLGSLEERLLWNSSPARRAIQAATLAAAVFYAIVDIHPFADGNGRLARIAMNWTLRRAGVPFVIQLFATPAQRREYTKAIKQTRTNTCLAAKGRVTQDQILDAYKATGALLPLVYLILNRLERTIVEFEKLEQEKGQLLSEEDEARASRLYRERAAKETCMICFDDNPNIATLCCGKAIHLNCMAEWLSQRNSCPQCRGELPYLPARMRAGRVEGGDQTSNGQFATLSNSGTTDDDDDDDDNEMHGQILLGGDPSQFWMHFQNNMYAEQSETEQMQNEDDTAEEMEGVNGTTEEYTTVEDQGTMAYTEPVPTPLPPFCAFGNCHNRSARDCANDACGQCCVMRGYYACRRHNTGHC